MTKIVITEANPGSAQEIRQRLAGNEFEVVGYARDGLEAAQMALTLKPEVLLLHEHLPGVSGFRTAELVTAATSDIAVVLLVDKENDVTLRKAMAVGARATVSAEATADVFMQALRDVSNIGQVREQPDYPLVTDPERMPRTIAISSAKGGVGRTTVAINLAVQFARKYPNQVVLVDGHGQFGDAAFSLDLSPASNIADLADFDELDPELVNTHLAVHAPSTLRVLGAPSLSTWQDNDMSRIDQPFMAAMLGLLRRAYRFVFFDLPPLVWPTSQYVFDRCQRILMVASLYDLPTIRNTKTLMESLAMSGGVPQRTRLIVNRTPWRGDFTVNDLESALGMQAYHQLPEDFETAFRALNVCNPVVLEYPNSNLARAFFTLADKLAAEL